MEKEKWINEVLNSASGLQKAEPSAFLFEKIALRIEQGKITTQKTGFAFLKNKWALGFIGMALLIINTVSLLSLVSGKQNTNTQKTVSVLNEELGYSNSYNY